MSSLIVIRETSEQTPLLQNSSLPAPNIGSTARDEEIVPSPSPSQSRDEPDSSRANSTDLKQRLDSLDVFRGLTVALMILVDDAGGAFPSINHSPWFGVTLADFVMPFFLFSVGVSVSLVFKKVSSKTAATKKVILRAIKLFLLGLILQGGYFHGRNNLTYGVDVNKIRWMGVLQRISLGYLLASLSEIWLVNNVTVDSTVSYMKKYFIQCIVAILFGSLYLSLLYVVYVPNWAFDVSSRNSSLSLSRYGSSTQTVHCGVRGSLEPPCNAVGLIDRIVLGENHLYQHPVYRRTKECSANSPDYGPLLPNSPGWCLAPFDPEGILSSLMAAITCLVGLHYGHIILHFKGHMQRMILWSFSSFPLLIIGYILDVLGVPLSKPLYTLSYMCITAGVSGLVLTIIFYVVDVKLIRKPTLLLQWMGMNALIVYAFAACDLLPLALQGFYWRSPENNLVNGTESLLQAIFRSKNWGRIQLITRRALKSNIAQYVFGTRIAGLENRGPRFGVQFFFFFLSILGFFQACGGVWKYGNGALKIELEYG